MKKILSVLLVGFVLLSGCGSKTTSNDSTINTLNDGKEVIDFNPTYVAIDDNNIKVEITSVSKEIHNAQTSSPYTEYRVNFTLTNKNTEYGASAMISQGNAGIGSYTVNFANSNCQVRPGKINDASAWTVNDYAKKDGLICRLVI